MFFLDGWLDSLAGVSATLFGILFFIRFLTDIKNERWRERLLGLACYSTSIYFFHEKSLLMLQKLETRFFPDTLPFQLLSYFGTAIFIVFYCIAISKFLERFQPRLYSLITGGRKR